MRRGLNRVVRTALLGAVAWMLGAASIASAAELKALAIMMPEEPTDYGWNQQGFNAAKTVAAKYGLKFVPATGLGYGDVHAQLRELADDGASLIIAHAAGYNTAAPGCARVPCRWCVPSCSVRSHGCWVPGQSHRPPSSRLSRS